MKSPLDILLQVTSVIDQLPARYAVVGSFASSARGIFRATNDIDLVSDLTVEHAFRFSSGLREDFYLDDEESLRKSIQAHRSFNLIHFDSSFKVDIFVPDHVDFGWIQLKHRARESIGPGNSAKVYISTAEDIILAKLIWFTKAGSVSSLQWKDILGVFATQSTRLDLDYLNQQAAELGLETLLQRAKSEAGF